MVYTEFSFGGGLRRGEVGEGHEGKYLSTHISSPFLSWHRAVVMYGYDL